MARIIAFACVLIFVIIPTTKAHVALTFPPARYPSLDFLDNVRTRGPCGVPKPPLAKGNPTTLRSGSTFNVTWTMTYPHQGGFRIELLDDKDQPRYALTAENVQFLGQEDQTTSSYQVTLPSDFECQNCGLRLLRQAGEWGEYQFWSCSDVNIVKEPTDPCQGHGDSKNGQCQCQHLYSGDSCQWKDECWADQDCGSNGKCEELHSFSYPRRVCFCKQGWFGPACSSSSTLQKTSIDLSQYEVQEFGADKNKLYWKILKEQNEVEIVLQYPSKSWIAIGWRPQNIPATCGNIERLANSEFGISSTSPPNPVAEPRPTSSESLPTLPNLPPYTTNETLPPAPFFIQSSNIADTTSPVGNGTFTTESTDISANQSVTNVQFGRNASVDTQYEGPFVTAIPGVVPGPGFTGTPVPFPPPYASGNKSQIGQPSVPESDFIGELCYGDWRIPNDCNENCDLRASWTYVEDTDEIEFSIEAKAAQNSWTALGFSSTGTMSDADMIVMKSLQNKLTIVDMFTTGYAPPAKDPLQNVTVGPVPGTHVNGVLRASFRRPRRSSDPHDVSFTENECYHFLLANGQLNADGSMNKHTSKPHVSKKKVCIGSCNPSPLGGGGEKYVTCDREFKFPPGCRPPACDYVANWTYISQTQEVIFQISAKEIGRWTGIGFSREGNMTNSDMVMGWVYENGTFVTDRFAYGRHQPAIDKQQDLKEVHGMIEDDIQTITFTRKMITNDPEDISLKECLYYLFPVGGGRVLARTSKDFQNKTTPLGFHDQTLPKISRDLICICNDDGIPVNITSNRLRRQAQEDEEEESEPQTHPPKRPPSLPQGQSSINITLGAKPIPVFDPKQFEDSQVTATSSVPAQTTTEEEDESESTTESLLKLQSAIVSINSSVTVAPVLATTVAELASMTIVQSTQRSPVPEPEPASNVTNGSSPNPQSAAPEPEPKPEPKPAPEPKPEGEPASASALHPMDCVDMIIGSAIGSNARVSDYYSISRSTPKLDDYFGGTQSLTAATGYEEDGITTIAFRRRLVSIDQFDHNITLNEPMFMIWAKGQEYGSYSHNEPSGLDRGGSSVKDYYGQDVLGYHGNKNRGSFSIEFGGKKSPNGPASTPSCKQEFVYPAGCKGDSCHYNITWLKYGGDVEFWLESHLTNNHWTGIGFSKDGLMAKSDAVIITTDTPGAPEVTDRFISGYEIPTPDKKQNIFNIEASYINGVLKAKFSRPLSTDDSDEDLDLNQCTYFLYPYNGGPINEHRMQKHSATPLRSSEQICLNQCHITSASGSGSSTQPNAVPEPTRTAPFTKKPPELGPAASVVDHGRKFMVVLRIINEQWNDALTVESSPEHEALAIKVIKIIDSLLRSKFAGYEKARVLKFTQGSVVAEVEVSAAGLNSVQIQEAIMPSISAGLVEGLQMDPEFLRVREIQVGLTPEEIRNYIIIAVACFLVMVATAFAVCMIVRTRRRRSKDIKANWNLVPFTPYAYLMPPSGAYPVAYQYPSMGPMSGMDPKKGQIYQDNALALSAAPTYSTEYSQTGTRQLGAHHRQYSNATTATPVNGKTPSPGSEKHVGIRATSSASSNKNGNSETSYAEWCSRVNGNGQQSQQPPTLRGQQPSAQPTPYVQYPNDPYSYYTLNGSQRAAPFMQSVPPRSVPPPGYYRPY